MATCLFAHKNLSRSAFIIFGALIVLGSFLFVYNNVLAADDNVNAPDCETFYDDCDHYQSRCTTTYSYDWTANGYPSGVGHALCCGDDSNEFYRVCQSVNTTPPVSWSCNSAAACCGATWSGESKACVDKSGICYAHLEIVEGLNAGGNDNIALCSSSGWSDCDGQCSICATNSEELNCGNCDNASNETDCTYPSNTGWAHGSGIGEYGFGGWQFCGDDAGEHYITSYCPGYTGGPQCCGSASDKIDASGNCVASCSCDCVN